MENCGGEVEMWRRCGDVWKWFKKHGEKIKKGGDGKFLKDRGE